MKKYSDLNKAEKQKYEKDLQRYKEDHIDEVKIMNPHKRYKTGTFGRLRGRYKFYLRE